MSYVVCAVLYAAIGFIAGVTYQRHRVHKHATVTTSNTTSGSNGTAMWITTNGTLKPNYVTTNASATLPLNYIYTNPTGAVTGFDPVDGTGDAGSKPAPSTREHMHSCEHGFERTLCYCDDPEGCTCEGVKHDGD